METARQNEMALKQCARVLERFDYLVSIHRFFCNRGVSKTQFNVYNVRDGYSAKLDL